MSRTDVHAPWWVITRDPAWRGEMHESHDHLHRKATYDRGAGRWTVHEAWLLPCDFADYLAGRDDTRCRYQVGSGRHWCGCRMCTDHHGRRLKRRQERVAWRRLRAVLLATPDREDVDVPPLRGSAW